MEDTQPPASSDLDENSVETNTVNDNGTKLDRRALTTKTAVTFLLEGKLKNNVCRYCLNVDTTLTELDRIIHIAIKGVICNVTVRNMIASFHPFKVEDDPNFPNKICEICLEQVLSSYLFALQCERAERALRNGFDDIYEKINKLDSLEITKKRGRAKLNPNYNILYTEHENIIDYAEPVINLINTYTELQDDTTHSEETKLRQYECLKCWQVYPSALALLNHEKIHPTSMWYHCRECGRSFPKRGQLKKHVQFNHSKKTRLNDSDITFTCKECNHVSTNYSTHLEHIEKHKFKRALKNLVERKMDRLCAVCLDKGNLKNLDQMICLHGGSPGLTGDVTLYNILGSIIPNKNANKYQEIHIPMQARVLKYVKKAKVPTKDLEPKFKLSLPLVVTAKYVKLNYINTFTFSKPNLNTKEMLQMNNDAVESNTELSKCVTDNGSINHCNDSEIKYTFANPDYFIEREIKRYKACAASTTTTRKFCTNCWIFANPCEKCNNNIENSSENTAICKFCWIFKNVRQCGVCQSKHTNKMAIEIHIDNRKTPSKIEAKNLTTNDIKLNPSKWQCNICLTNNSGVELDCLCCKANQMQSERFHASFNFPETISTYLHNSYNFEVSLETQTDKTDKEPNTKVKYQSINEKSTDIPNTDDDTQTTEMEIEILNNGDIQPKAIIKFEQSELMDTEEYDSIGYFHVIT